MIEVADSSGLESHQEQHQRFILADSSGEDQEMKAPKKRAETWVQEETLSLINFRREMDGLFNTSKSNKHLWEEISSKMRDKGFDRSPTMCTDKWRNLLKEFKKTKYQDQAISPKLTYYKELDELIKGRNKNVSPKTSVHSKDDTFFQFNEKGLSDASIPFDSVEGDRTFNLERSSDHESHPLAITNDADVAGNGVPPWNWRDTPGNGDSNTSYGGRVITVKWGDLTRRIGIDGDAAAIKEAIKSVFGLRTKRAFWLEDEDEVVRSFDRNMPLGTYTLHLDEGITIKICYYDESGRIPVRTEEKTLYNEDAFNELLGRYGWNYLKELSGFRTVDSLEELCPGVMYHGV